MMWLAPAYLAAGGVASLVVVALHFLAWRRPPAAPLPTARFVPDAPARARARATLPVDRWLLLLRVTALLLVAAAFARPVRQATRAPLGRVVIADLSASTASAEAVRAAVGSAWRPGDVVVALGDTLRVVGTPDSLPRMRGIAPGRLSAALVAAHDAARRVATSADSAELVLVSPLAREEVDAATRGLGTAWRGRARHVIVAPATVVAGAGAPVRVEAGGDDAIAAGVAASGLRAAGEVRLVRRAVTAGDEEWVRGAAGRVLVSWPVADTPTGTGVRALAWEDDALIAVLAPVEPPPAEGRVVARWADGAPAAAERAMGAGCVREVRVALPRAGDVTLASGFARLLATLALPCGGRRDLAPTDAASLGLREGGAARALPRPAPSDPWGIARRLLAAAIVLLALEPLLRRSRREVEQQTSGDARSRAAA